MNGHTSPRRRIGQILHDGGFLTRGQLDHALVEQQKTNELLGQVLVRMGILDPGDVNAVLAVQERLGSLEQAVRLGAGERQVLGALLVGAGRVTPEQLSQALARQRSCGGRLGEICVGLGFISQQELDGLLAFQHHQDAKDHCSPLRLGELLVAAGQLTRRQLEDALKKQPGSGKKLGEVLVEEGYLGPHQVTRGIRLQRLLTTSVLAAILSFATLSMTGCGGGGGSPEPVAVSAGSSTSAAPSAAGNFFTMRSEGYPMMRPTFYYSTNNPSFWSIQALVAKSATDIDGVGVFRIDIQKEGRPLPLLNKTYSIEKGTGFETFPGTFVVYNGQTSTLKKVERGTISFSSASVATEAVEGTFDVTMTDYDSTTVPAPQYRLSGAFRFVIGTSGPAAPGA